MISNGTAYGQLTPQRINYNGTKGVFFTQDQETQLLKTIVDYDYLRAALVRRDSTIKIMQYRIDDRDQEIKKANEAIVKADKRTIDCANTNADLNSQLVNTKTELKNTQGKLHTSRTNNWIFGGISVLLLSILIITN